MMTQKKIAGLALAATAAIAFSAAPLTSAMAAGKHHNKVACYGMNKCKGQSKCKTSANACKGQNQCKGQGKMMVKSEAACKKMGGTTQEKATDTSNTTATTSQDTSK